MYIKTQNEEVVVNMNIVNRIKIGIGCLSGEVIINAYFTNGSYECLGKYKSPKRAKEILNEICNTYEDSCYCNDGYDSTAQTNRPYLSMRNIVFKMPEK